MIRPSVEAAGINMSYHYRWLKDDPGYAASFAELEQRVVDQTLAKRRPHARGYKIKGARVEERRRKQEAMLAALAKSGIVLDAARETGVSAASFYKWFREDEEFAARAAQILEDTQELSRKIKAKRTGAASRAAWDDPERREQWGEYQRAAWTAEKREAAGQRNRDRMEDPEFRERWLEANRAGSTTPEARANNSARMKRLWADPAYRAKYIAAIADEDRRARLSEKAKREWEGLTPDERKEKMRPIRSAFKGGHKLTQIEAEVMMALNERRLPYLVHLWVEGFVADAFVPSLNLVIEADGAQFHPVDGTREAARDAALLALGYETLRLTEAEIKGREWARLDAAIARLTQQQR
jgi:very-short-patch-repair endonuclease